MSAKSPRACHSVDPIVDQFPHLSSYNYAENKPITFIDLHGLQAKPRDFDFESLDGPSDIVSFKMVKNFGVGVLKAFSELSYQLGIKAPIPGDATSPDGTDDGITVLGNNKGDGTEMLPEGSSKVIVDGKELVLPSTTQKRREYVLEKLMGKKAGGLADDFFNTSDGVLKTVEAVEEAYNIPSETSIILDTTTSENGEKTIYRIETKVDGSSRHSKINKVGKIEQNE